MSEAEKVALIDRVVSDLNARSSYSDTDADTALISRGYEPTEADVYITVREFVNLVLRHAA